MTIALEHSHRRGSDPDALIEWLRGVALELFTES